MATSRVKANADKALGRYTAIAAGIGATGVVLGAIISSLIGLYSSSQDYKALETQLKVSEEKVQTLLQENSDLSNEINNLKETTLSKANAIHNQGIKALEDEKDIDKATNLFNESLAIKSKILGDNHPDLTITYFYLGGTYFAKNNWTKAFEMWSDTLQLRQTEYTNSAFNLVWNYQNLGHTNKNLGNIEAARTCFEKGYELSLYALGEKAEFTKAMKKYIEGLSD